LETAHELSSVSILADASRKVRVESQDSLMPRDISTMTLEPVDHNALRDLIVKGALITSGITLLTPCCRSLKPK